MVAEELQPKVDYFYCEECKEHVPCIRVEVGVWEVCCSHCVGECSLCVCHLAEYCFGQGEVDALRRMFVTHIAAQP
jgi:hypothetical protein